MISDQLEQIGLSENESSVYLELLKIGPQAASVIAKKLNINRTSTYYILEGLQQKGLITPFFKGQTKYFAANDPNCLIGYLDRKCRTMDYYRDLVLSMVPDFRAMANSGTLFRGPVVSHYEGIEGVNYLLSKAILANGSIRASVQIGNSLDSIFYTFLADLPKLQDSQTPSDILLLLPSNEVSKKLSKIVPRDSRVKFLPLEEFAQFFSINTLIFDDKICYIDLSSGFEYGVMIDANYIANSTRLMFDKLWTQAT